MESGDHESLTDCSRRLSRLEDVVGEFRNALAAKSEVHDKELGGLAGALSTERERASGYAFRIAALEGVKPLGISTVLVTAAAVIGVIALVGGGYLNMMQRLDDKDTALLNMRIDTSDRNAVYVDTRQRELAIELRNADRDGWIRQDESRQKIAALEEQTRLLALQIDAVDSRGSRRWMGEKQ